MSAGMGLFDVLSLDERVIVVSSLDSQQLYTWNQSVTLQVWQCEVDRNGGETWH